MNGNTVLRAIRRLLVPLRFALRASPAPSPHGSWKAPFRFLVCIGTMNLIGTPPPPRPPQGGEGGAEGPERGGSWRASFPFCARIGTVTPPLPRPPAPLSPIGGEGGGEGEVHGKPPFAFAHAL